MEERFLLIKDRIKEITYEKRAKEPFRQYFEEVASFLIVIMELAQENADRQLEEYLTKDLMQQSIEDLLAQNHKLFGNLREDLYENSFLDPAFAVQRCGEEFGRFFSFLYAEMYAAIPYAYEIMYRVERLEQIVIRAELFVEVYVCFCQMCEELLAGADADRWDSDKIPATVFDELKEILYWFISDYAQPLMEQRVAEKVDPAECYAAQILRYANLDDPRYLFAFGEYIGENQLRMAEYLAACPEEKLRLMADTYTEGYRIGFIKGNKDLSKKKVVQIAYPLGFEQMIKRAIGNFADLGLEPTIMRTPHSIFHKRGTSIGGYFSDSPNRQFDFDHREDEALFLDKKLVGRKLEITRECYEQKKVLAAVHAGPAWVETFGEKTFDPVMKKEACRLSEKQQELSSGYYAKLGRIINEYIKGEERSFTIIAFPVPEIGERFSEIMDRTIELNTLDYELYETMQQRMIDALDRAEYVRIKGRGENETDLQVALCKLDDGDKQTKFENCVADVNIPVGEVFTSPVLQGTNGILHVGSVFLKGFEFRDLKIRFADGRVTEYSCGNFPTVEENRAYIRENILYHHETLPLGEFAIGTNTTAYVMAREFGIADKLPILIAEKTGPHFALGDTCDSHADDIAVFNSDGKEIIARDNEISILRRTEPEKAYFQCHTDITIPYDELDCVYGVDGSGEQIPIIRGGRFVLPGTDKLNEPFVQRA
ncbi:MAG: aminopeptidase [Lachnospiraceae bacterium]|nr:aminopeptidase [Lachnospiraceae bacterium]